MPEQLEVALAEVRALLLDPGLTRAVAAGRRRGQPSTLVRAELRPVALKAGARLQIATFDGARPHTRNVAPGPESDAAVDALLAEPFGNWHVETATATVQVRVTKKGDAQVHRAAADRGTATTSRSPLTFVSSGAPLRVSVKCPAPRTIVSAPAPAAHSPAAAPETLSVAAELSASRSEQEPSFATVSDAVVTVIVAASATDANRQAQPTIAAHSHPTLRRLITRSRTCAVLYG